MINLEEMYLVQEKYGAERYFITSGADIKRGIYYDTNNDLLCNCDKAVFEKWIALVESGDYDKKFYEFLDDEDIEYKFLSSEKYISLEDINELIFDYVYYYNEYFDTYTSSEDILNFEIEYYFEYLDKSSNCKQIVLYDVNEDDKMTLIDEDIEGYKERKTSEIDLYKDNDNNLWIKFISYYQGDIGYAEITTAKRLKEDYDYVQ